VRWEGDAAIKTHYVKKSSELPDYTTYFIEKDMAVDVLTGKRSKLEMSEEQLAKGVTCVSPDGKVVA
jgi:hypothetical protein